MLDYTKIKSGQLNTNHSQNILREEEEEEEGESEVRTNVYQYMNNVEITYSDELHYIDLRIKSLSIFEKIKDQTRDIIPPLFDKLTIEDLMELIDPEFKHKMEQIHF